MLRTLVVRSRSRSCGKQPDLHSLALQLVHCARLLSCYTRGLNTEDLLPQSRGSKGNRPSVPILSLRSDRIAFLEQAIEGSVASLRNLQRHSDVRRKKRKKREWWEMEVRYFLRYGRGRCLTWQQGFARNEEFLSRG